MLECQLRIAKIACVMGHYRISVSGDRKFNEMVVGLVAQVGTPKEMYRNGPAFEKKDFEEGRAFALIQTRPHEGFMTRQDIFVFEEKRRTHQRYEFFSNTSLYDP